MKELEGMNSRGRDGVEGRIWVGKGGRRRRRWSRDEEMDSTRRNRLNVLEVDEGEGLELGRIKVCKGFIILI